MPKIGNPSPAVQSSKRIAHLDETLPKRLDELNAAIIEAESRLRSLKPIVGVWHNYMDVSDETGIVAYRYVGFAKHQSKWKILFCEQEVNGPESPNCLLTDQPMDIRVDAAAEIPHLYNLIIEKKEEFASKVSDTITLLKTFAQTS